MKCADYRLHASAPEANSGERTQADAHQGSCVDCKEWTRVLEAGMNAIELPDVEPPAGDWERLNTALDGLGAAPPVRPLVALNCTYCHDRLVAGADGTVYCAACLAPHHLDCFKSNKGCGTPACQGVSTVTPVLQVLEGGAGKPWGAPKRPLNGDPSPVRRVLPWLLAATVGAAAFAGLTWKGEPPEVSATLEEPVLPPAKAPPPSPAKAPAPDTSGGVGALIEIVEGRARVLAPLRGTPAWAARLLPGDVIAAVDGEELTGLTQTADAVDELEGPPGSVVQLTVERPGSEAPLQFSLTRALIRRGSVRHARILADGIGYLLIEGFYSTTAQECAKAIEHMEDEGMRALILDLRGNRGGYIDAAVDLAGLFLPNGTLLASLRERDSNVFVEDYRTRATFQSRVPLAILINGHTSGASEVFAGGLGDHRRATLVGERSRGKGLLRQAVKVINAALEPVGLEQIVHSFYTPLGRPLDQNLLPNEDTSWGVLPKVHASISSDARIQVSVAEYARELAELQAAAREESFSAEETLHRQDPQIAAAFSTLLRPFEPDLDPKEDPGHLGPPGTTYTLVVGGGYSEADATNVVRWLEESEHSPLSTVQRSAAGNQDPNAPAAPRVFHSLRPSRNGLPDRREVRVSSFASPDMGLLRGVRLLGVLGAPANEALSEIGPLRWSVSPANAHWVRDMNPDRIAAGTLYCLAKWRHGENALTLRYLRDVMEDMAVRLPSGRHASSPAGKRAFRIEWNSDMEIAAVLPFMQGSLVERIAGLPPPDSMAEAEGVFRAILAAGEAVVVGRYPDLMAQQVHVVVRRPEESPLDERERRAIAKTYFAQGEKAYEEFRYAKAAELFRKAVALDPYDEDARNYVIRAELLAGELKPELDDSAEEVEPDPADKK